MKRSCVYFFKPLVEPKIRLAIVNAEIAYRSTRLPNRWWHTAGPIALGMLYHAPTTDDILAFVIVVGGISTMFTSIAIEEKYDILKDFMMEKVELEARLKQ